MTRLAGPHICTDQLRLSADGPRLPIIPIPTALLSESYWPLSCLSPETKKTQNRENNNHESYYVDYAMHWFTPEFQGGHAACLP